MTDPNGNCPACSHNRSRDYRPERFYGAVQQCRKCSAIYTNRHIYLGDSYTIVEPHFTADRTADERAVYFDLDTLGSKGIGRRHGWFDPETGLVTQVG